jgi:hypothetical protein
MDVVASSSSTVDILGNPKGLHTEANGSANINIQR